MATRIAIFLLLSTMVAVLVVPHPLTAETVPQWPTDQEKRLKAVDTQLLDVQRKRFRAIFFSNDPDAVKDLDTQYRSLQKERRELIDATGGR